MDAGEFELKENEAGGAIFYRQPRMGTAEVTFTKPEAGLIAITHTYVPDDYRGQGIALQLLEKVVAYARDNAVKVQPICPYAVNQFARHPDWEDLLAV